MKKYVRLTDKEKVDIIERYTVGLIPMIELAAKYNITRQSVHKLLRAAEINTSKQAAHIKLSCCCCGKEIIRLRCQVRKTKHMFCGDDCYSAWLKHGNGNPLIMHRHASRSARVVVSKYYALRPDEIVHHEDRNQNNNLIHNLKVFKNQGDHVRYHRGFIVPIMFDGSL